jgi:hypothetical protein
MALHNRTITQMLNLAITIQTPLQTDPRLTAAEQAQIGENLIRCNAVLGDVNPNTNLVPANRRNGDATVLNDRVTASTVIDDKYFQPLNQPETLYDALDLMRDAASAILAGQPSVISDLSPARP